MTSSGWGQTTFGTVPFYVGSTVPLTAPPARKPGVAFLDPLTGDYVIGSDGELSKMPSTRQRVMLICTTKLGSAAAATQMGIQLPSKIGDGFEEQAETAIRTGLQPLVDDGSLTLDAVSADRTSVTGRARLTIEYTDLRSGEKETVAV